MKVFYSFIIFCLSFSSTYASTSGSIKDVCSEGQRLVNEGEYNIALRTFESVVEEMAMCNFDEDKLCYLSASFNAAILAEALEDFQSAEKHHNIFVERSQEWFGQTLEINPYLPIENVIVSLSNLLDHDTHWSWGAVFICNGCNRTYNSHPGTCATCGSGSFRMKSILPPGTR